MLHPLVLMFYVLISCNLVPSAHLVSFSKFGGFLCDCFLHDGLTVHILFLSLVGCLGPACYRYYSIRTSVPPMFGFFPIT